MQIVVIGEGGVGLAMVSEPYLAYYDILVRHPTSRYRVYCGCIYAYCMDAPYCMDAHRTQGSPCGAAEPCKGAVADQVSLSTR